MMAVVVVELALTMMVVMMMMTIKLIRKDTDSGEE